MPTILRLSGHVSFCMCVYICVFVYMCVYICVFVYMCVCVCVCVCVKRIGIFRLSFVTDFGRWVVVGVEEG